VIELREDLRLFDEAREGLLAREAEARVGPSSSRVRA
jgi:hypothetical protein